MMSESRILITNYPKMCQRPTYKLVGSKSEILNLVCGYDIQVDKHDVTLQIARDLITALLCFDKIYIEGNHIWDIMQVWGSAYVKELLRLHILCVIPDQELNPVMMQKNNGEWRHNFFPYPQGCAYIGREYESASNQIHRWSHIENCFNMHDFYGLEAKTILYLIDENAVEFGDSKEFIKKVNAETELDIFKPEFLRDSRFYRQHPTGGLEYNQVSRIRLQELNKSVILAEALGIDNIKMDATINELMVKKTVSAFSKTIYSGTDVLLKLEQQKGFPDLGELFVNKIIGLDDILKLRDCFQGKIFRYWAKQSAYDEDLMRKEIMNSTRHLLGSKIMNPIRMLACNLVGITGFIPGIVASAFDSYILNAVSQGWHPNFFLDDKLKRMIDDCVAKEERKIKIEKLNETFAGVGRNDLCPCGSGKKIKKCHGRDLLYTKEN